MNYCSYCGFDVLFFKILVGDNWLCYVCGNCGCIYYFNLKIVVGCLFIWEDKVLLVKCFIEFCFGYWNVFSGYMENGEMVEEGVLWEVREEVMV